MHAGVTENGTHARAVSTGIQKDSAAAPSVRSKTTAKLTTNSAMGAKQVRECCKLDAESRGYLEHAMEQMNFSADTHGTHVSDLPVWRRHDLPVQER
jgi:predicted ATPase with chaperone activity